MNICFGIVKTMNALSRREIIIFSFIIFLLTIFFRVGNSRLSANELPRFYLIHSIVSRGELSVDHEVKKFGKDVDMSYVNGKYYSDKAPFISFISLPLYKAYYTLMGGKITDLNSVWYLKAVIFAPFAILLFWLMYIYIYSFSKNKNFAILTSFAGIFATPIFLYFSIFFSHSVTASLLFLFFMMVKMKKNVELNRYQSALYFAAAGVVGGFTFINEYQAVFSLSIISIYLFFRMENRKEYIYFLMGGAAVFLFFISYNKLVFGSWISFGVSHAANTAFKVQHSKGLFGITYPKLAAVKYILGSFNIGIFTLSPFLFFALPGIYSKLKKNRSEALIILSVILVYAYVVFSLRDWQGGNAFGARYSVPFFPFLIVFAAHGVHFMTEKFGNIVKLLFSAITIPSLIVFSFALVLQPLSERKMFNPIANFYLTRLRENYFPFKSILSFIGVPKNYSGYIFILLITVLMLTLIYFYLNKKGRLTNLLSVAAASTALLALVLTPHVGKKRDYSKTYYYIFVQQNKLYKKFQKENFKKNKNAILKKYYTRGDYEDWLKNQK